MNFFSETRSGLGSRVVEPPFKVLNFPLDLSVLHKVRHAHADRYQRGDREEHVHVNEVLLVLALLAGLRPPIPARGSSSKVSRLLDDSALHTI